MDTTLQPGRLHIVYTYKSKGQMVTKSMFTDYGDSDEDRLNNFKRMYPRRTVVTATPVQVVRRYYAELPNEEGI